MDLYIFVCMLTTFAPWPGDERCWSVAWIPSLHLCCWWGLCFIAQQRTRVEVRALTEQKRHLREMEVCELKHTKNHSGLTSPFCTVLLCSLIITCYTLISPFKCPLVTSPLIPLKYKPTFWIIFTKLLFSQYFKTKFQYSYDTYGHGSLGRNVS